MTGSRPATGNSVGNIDKNRFFATKFLVFVVFADGIDDGNRKVEFLQELDTEFDVTTFGVINNLADVVKKTTKPNCVNVGLDLLS